MGNRVIHHFAPSAWPELATYDIPPGSEVISTAMRRSNAGAMVPAVYVKKPSDPTEPFVSRRLQTFFVGTGHEFNDGTFSFVGTVGDGPFVWRVFARIL